MTGEDMKAIRHELGLSTVQLGRAFGYAGEDNTASVVIRKYESGARPIPAYLQRLLLMFQRHGVPQGWTSRLHTLIADVKRQPIEEDDGDR
jgi:DNA-binding transcriptional regulator YiaG